MQSNVKILCVEVGFSIVELRSKTQEQRELIELVLKHAAKAVQLGKTKRQIIQQNR